MRTIFLAIVIAMAVVDSVLAEEPKLLNSITCDKANIVCGIVFAPGGKNLAWINGGEPRLWQIGTPKNADNLVVHGVVHRVQAVAFDRAGAMVAFGGFRDGIGVWNVNSRKRLLVLGSSEHNTHQDADDPFTGMSISFGSDGKSLISCRCNGGSGVLVETWGLESRKSSREQLKTKLGGCQNVTLNPDRTKLAATGFFWAEYLELFDLTTSKNIATLQGQGNGISDCCFSENGRLLSVAMDRCVQLWDVASKRNVATFQCEAGPSVSTFGIGGKVLAVGDHAREVTLWEVASRKRMGKIKLPWNPQSDAYYAVSAVEFSPNGDILAVGQYDGTVTLWETGRFVVAVKATPPGEVNGKPGNKGE